MPIHLLYPTAVVFNWHSANGLHKSTIPARAWIPGGPAGTFTTWGGGSIAAEDMIDAFVEDWADVNPATSIMDQATIYTYSEPGAPALPRAIHSLGVAGTLVGDAIPASQGTLTMRDTEINKFKLVFLDTVPSADFISQKPSSFSAAINAIVAELIAETNAWQSRAGFRIQSAISLAWTMNQALQQQYRRSVV